MGLEKAIEHGKEKRQPFRGSKRWDSSCRNHGRCPWCERNRRHGQAKAEPPPPEWPKWRR